jgi:rhamnosyltransferase
MSQLIQAVSAVVVCFHPDAPTLRSLVEQVSPDLNHIVLVNNGPQGQLNGDWGGQVLVVECDGNIGVAAALNRGFEQAFAQGADAVIGFDQDSQPESGLVKRLCEHWNQEALLNPHKPLGAIGPALRDREAHHLMHAFAPYNWLRQRFWAKPGGRYAVDHLITSGCLISLKAWRQVGGLNEDLFIDWVDVEWCGRAHHAGLHVLMDGDAVLFQRIGARSQSFAGRHFHVHPPFRHYFVVRNALLILRDPRFPLGWRCHHVLYALRVVLVSLVFVSQRAERLGCVVRGVLDGLARRTGAQGRIPKN